MGRIKHGIIGPVSGIVGAVVGASWKGISYLRSRPKKKKRKKKTEGELSTTTSFGFLSSFLKPFQPYIKIGFMHHAVQQSEWNAGLSENSQNGLVSSYPDLIIDYSKLVLGKGNLPGVLSPVMSFANGMISIQWEANLIGDGVGNDQIMLIIYDKITKQVTGFIGAAQRGSLHCSYGLSPVMLSGQLEVYLGLTSWDRSQISDTQYIGTMIPADI